MSGQATTGWRVVADAIQKAIVAASGLTRDRVLWWGQNRNQPTVPYIELAMPRIDSRGIDWVLQTYNPNATAGQEFINQVQGTREIPIELSAYTETTADGLNAFTEAAAIFLAERVRTQLRLPTIKNVMAQVGVSIFDKGGVDFVPQVVAVSFRGRATCSMRAYVPAQAVLEMLGYIATVNGTLTAAGDDPSSPYVLPFTAKVG